jgi:hypothetical protein
MATSSREWNPQVLIEREDREVVLSVISASQSVTIEELLHHLPWMRWGYLFSILGECLQEGSVILCQKEFQFEVRAIHPSQSGSGADVPTVSVLSSPERYHLTRS